MNPHAGYTIRRKLCDLALLKTEYYLLLIVTGLVLTGQVSPSWAGGLYITEFGTPSMGTANAGAEAWANNASTAFHNSAGMTRLEGNELMMTAGFGYADLQFDPSPATPFPGDDGGQAGGPFPILGTFYSHRVTDDLRLGFNVTSITGALINYGETWAGRFLNTKVKLLNVTLAPSLAYRVMDNLSLGAGLLVVVAGLEIKAAVPLPGGRQGEVKIDGTAVQPGYNLSALYEVT